MSHPSISQQITFFYTEDLESTANFYEEVMGLKLALDQGVCRIYLTAPGAFLGFCQRIEVQSDHLNVIFTLVTRDVDGWFEYLQQKGVVIEKEPVFNPRFNIYHFFLRDPNGYLIEVQHFLDPNREQEDITNRIS